MGRNDEAKQVVEEMDKRGLVMGEKLKDHYQLNVKKAWSPFVLMDCTSNEKELAGKKSSASLESTIFQIMELDASSKIADMESFTTRADGVRMEGEMTGMRGELTELRSTCAELRSTCERIENMFYNMMHDTRHPLTYQ
ncbi:hypothetical protein CFOL_v3_07617 [Cephalotus follicularis]|uniref:Uncharacterized protein n=1 Tax=Cephalotus follicularis TaxID=3775 RepID=A0A1Q3B846_CEPFO|nr:hypothetical protein CFOL_v3_07617 [Cephalotus follicularis]